MLAHLGKFCVTLIAIAVMATAALVTSPVSAAPDPTETQAPQTASPQPAPKDSTNRRAGYDINLMTFNILTSSIAAGGTARANSAANEVQKYDRTVLAFQEVAADQLRTLRQRLPRYKFYPRRSLGPYDSAIQVAWKTTKFKAKKKGVIKRPFLGRKRSIPYVKLQEKATGRTFWVVAIHNSPGGLEQERDISTAAEIKLIKRLARSGKKPVIVMGDMNERVEFCQRVAKATNLISTGGKRKNPCPVPRRAGPDWIMAPEVATRFSNHAKVYNGISDHPMVVADVRILAKKKKKKTPTS